MRPRRALSYAGVVIHTPGYGIMYARTPLTRGKTRTITRRGWGKLPRFKAFANAERAELAELLTAEEVAWWPASSRAGLYCARCGHGYGNTPDPGTAGAEEAETVYSLLEAGRRIDVHRDCMYPGEERWVERYVMGVC